MTTGREFEFRQDWKTLAKAVGRGAVVACPECDGQSCSECIRAAEALARVVARLVPHAARSTAP